MIWLLLALTPGASSSCIYSDPKSFSVYIFPEQTVGEKHIETICLAIEFFIMIKHDYELPVFLSSLNAWRWEAIQMGSSLEHFYPKSSEDRI